jgi:hypothetical protein
MHTYLEGYRGGGGQEVLAALGVDGGQIPTGGLIGAWHIDSGGLTGVYR